MEVTINQCEVLRKIPFLIHNIIIAHFLRLIAFKRASKSECLCFGSLCPAQIIKQAVHCRFGMPWRSCNIPVVPYDDLNHWNLLRASMKGQDRQYSIWQPRPNFYRIGFLNFEITTTEYFFIMCHLSLVHVFCFLGGYKTHILSSYSSIRVRKVISNG